MIYPVPDKAAQHIIAASDCFPVFFQSSYGISHCVVILTHYIWDLSFTGSSLYRVHGWIHVTSHVNTHLISLAFAVYRSCRVIVLEIPDHISVQTACCIRIRSISHLITNRPHDNGRIVSQMFICCLCTVHSHLIEQCLQSVVVLPVIYQINGMAFHIGFTHHIESVFIAQPVQIIVIAVMRCSDCIQVILFHQGYIFQIGLLRNHSSMERIRIMTVCTF